MRHTLHDADQTAHLDNARRCLVTHEAFVAMEKDDLIKTVSDVASRPLARCFYDRCADWESRKESQMPCRKSLACVFTQRVTISSYHGYLDTHDADVWGDYASYTKERHPGLNACILLSRTNRARERHKRLG